ncbi:MAG: hypothetical protein C4524_14685 [Candidatus Zixiibacteriota bacterium]|nr:MAG: hypothetical protein C4524_14685 [candidate division Zixibacteria bacterium]
MHERIAIALAVVGWVGSGWAQPPNFDYPCLIYNPEGPVVNGNAYSSAAVGDWDGDGDADLLAGVYFYGHVHRFENVASPGPEPQYGPGALVTASGQPLQVSYG